MNKKLFEATFPQCLRLILLHYFDQAIQHITKGCILVANNIMLIDVEIWKSKLCHSIKVFVENPISRSQSYHKDMID